MEEKSDNEPYYITIEVVNERCQGLKMLKDLGVQQCTLVDVRSVPNGLTRHLIRFPSKEIKKDPITYSFKIIGSRREGQTSAWFDTRGCDLCRTVLANNSFLISGRNVEDFTIVYSFVTPNFKAFKEIISILEARGLKPRILEIGKFKPKRKILTERQERVLWIALKMGFFDFPRKLTMQELAHRLGISLSTLSEITRRGTRRLMENHFET